MTYLSASPFMSPALLRQGANLRAEIQRSSLGMTTGQTEDTGRAVGGDISGLAGIDSARARLTGYAAAAADIALLADAMQSAIAAIGDLADQTGNALLLLPDSATAVQIAAATAGGVSGFASALAALNTQVSGRALFGGTVTDAPPLPDAATLLTSLETALTGVSSASDAITVIDGWFNGPAGYAAFYRGGPARDDVPIAANDRISLDVTALEPALRDSLSGLAVAALVERGLLAGQSAAQSTLLRKAAGDVLASAESRNQRAAGIGVIQARTATAQTRNSAEDSALLLLRADLTAADPYESATRLKDAEARLDAYYTLVSRLSRLTLTEYL